MLSAEAETLMYIIPTVLFLVALLFLIFNRNEKQQKLSHKLPPGNACLPFIGETSSFLKPRSPTRLGEFMENHISRYGKIFSTHLFGKRGIVSADAELNRFVLKSEGKSFRQGFPPALQKLLGPYGLILAQGEVHKHMRSTVLDFVNGKRMREIFLQDAEQIASQIISSWKEGQVISAKKEATKFTFYIMVKKILSMTQEYPEIEMLVHEYESWTRGFDSNPLYMHFPGSLHRKALKARKYIIQTFIREMEVRMATKRRENTGPEKDDFLGWLMKNTDYSQEKICDFLLGVLFAGHDTVSQSISLLIYFLEQCPKATKQLRVFLVVQTNTPDFYHLTAPHSSSFEFTTEEEHLQIVRSNKQHESDSKLTLDDIRRMDFTRCVINETLRLGNVVSFLPKTVTKDVQFKGYTIPQGYTVQVHLAAVHLDPSLYEDPESFNPWRWTSSSDTNINNGFMPFGGGLRLCPGADVARLEMSVFLHHLILKHDWELVEPDHPTTVRFIKYSKGLPIKVRPISTNL